MCVVFLIIKAVHGVQRKDTKPAGPGVGGGAVEGGWINGLVEVGALWMRTKSHRAERV